VQRILQNKFDVTQTRIVDGISEIPEGLPADVNAQHNWAARGMFRFLPTLDMDWLLKAHGSRRNEQSRVGQSSGTAGTYCDPDEQDLAGNCKSGVDPPARINGLLGSQDGGRYREPDTLEMFQDSQQAEIEACGLACVRVQDRNPGDDPNIPFDVNLKLIATNNAVTTTESAGP